MTTDEMPPRLDDRPEPQPPAGLVDRAARALWDLEFDDDWSQAAPVDREIFTNAALAMLTAALEGCETREEWRYVLENGEATVWGWGKPLLPVAEYLALPPVEDCRVLPVVRREHRFVITTSGEVAG